MNNTTNNLYSFRILFLIKGILTLCFSLLFLVYGFMGFFMSNLDEFQSQSDELPFNPAIILMVIGAIGFIFAVVIGVLTILAAKYIKEHKNYIFIFAISIVNALTGILGILLAVFTIIELNKPEIKKLFDKSF